MHYISFLGCKDDNAKHMNAKKQNRRAKDVRGAPKSYHTKANDNCAPRRIVRIATGNVTLLPVESQADLTVSSNLLKPFSCSYFIYLNSNFK